jgi:hypothetical protein
MTFLKHAPYARLVVVALIAACSDRPQTGQVERQKPATAADALVEVDRLYASGSPDAALVQAKAVISSFPGSAEADSVQRLLPIIESAARDSSEARGRREANAAAEAERNRLAAKWTYTADSDAMTGRSTRSAVIESENTVEFDFPYEGPQHGTLVIRNHPSYGQDVMLTIREGQILCPSYDDCTVRIRFDEGSPESWSGIGSGDNSTTVVFIRGYSRFVQRLRSAKIVRIQIPVYQEGQPVFEFHTGGYDHKKFQGEK